jgi:hypothetical protein
MHDAVVAAVSDAGASARAADRGNAVESCAGAGAAARIATGAPLGAFAGAAQ